VPLADQGPEDRIAVRAGRHVLWLQNLHGWFDVFVLARQVHPEQDAVHLTAGFALSELVFADPFGVPDAAPRPMPTDAAWWSH
jgi:hypothetical protein